MVYAALLFWWIPSQSLRDSVSPAGSVRSRENDNQSFSNTLAPLRYPKGEPDEMQDGVLMRYTLMA